MPEDRPRGGYRDELAAAYARIAELEARNAALARGAATPAGDDVVPGPHARALEARLRRWDRVRATLATLLGLSGLLALVVAERRDVHAALLATCGAMVAVGIVLAWPELVRRPVDPREDAEDVSRAARRRRRAQHDGRQLRVHLDAEASAAEPATVEMPVAREAAQGRALGE